MKVLAVKNIEPFGNLWAVRYIRLTARGMKQVGQISPKSYLSLQGDRILNSSSEYSTA
jgi:hypothetical protein